MVEEITSVQKMQDCALQRNLFDKISSVIAPDKNLATEVSCALGISIHGAYRRLRGEVSLSMSELQTLVETYDLGLLHDITESATRYIFEGRDLTETRFNYLERLDDYITTYQKMVEAGNVQLSYLGIDISPAYLHSSPVLVSFLDFFWNNCYVKNNLSNSDSTLQLKNIPDQVKSLTEKYFNVHQSCPSAEIWSSLCLESFLNQVEYVKSLQLFATPGDADLVYNELTRIINFCEKQAHAGVKLQSDGSVPGGRVPYNLYCTEMFFGENVMHVQTSAAETTVIRHNLFYIFTGHKLFAKNFKNTFNLMLAKSSPISATNEKTRIGFFKKLSQRIQLSRESV